MNIYLKHFVVTNICRMCFNLSEKLLKAFKTAINRKFTYMKDNHK